MSAIDCGKKQLRSEHSWLISRVNRSLALLPLTINVRGLAARSLRCRRLRCFTTDDFVSASLLDGDIIFGQNTRPTRLDAWPRAQQASSASAPGDKASYCTCAALLRKMMERVNVGRSRPTPHGARRRRRLGTYWAPCAPVLGSRRAMAGEAPDHGPCRVRVPG